MVIEYYYLSSRSSNSNRYNWYYRCIDVAKQKVWDLIWPSKTTRHSVTVHDVTHPNLKYNLVELTEPMGPTATDPTIEALVASEETKEHRRYQTK